MYAVQLSQAAGNSDIVPSLQLLGLLHDHTTDQKTKSSHGYAQKSQPQAIANASTALSPAVSKAHSGIQHGNVQH